jgi:hypothetical protein
LSGFLSFAAFLLFFPRSAPFFPGAMESKTRLSKSPGPRGTATWCGTCFLRPRK